MNPNFDPSWTLFLDRDGVINQRIRDGYVLCEDEFHFESGALDALATISPLFGRVIVVTNQQCIAKGLISESNLHQLHRYMMREILKVGGRIDKVYFAPELSSDSNNSRKPKPNMALKAQEDFPEIDFNRSVMVGDTDSDILFGQILGMYTVRVQGFEQPKVIADLSVQSLFDLSERWKQ